MLHLPGCWLGSCSGGGVKKLICWRPLAWMHVHVSGTVKEEAAEIWSQKREGVVELPTSRSLISARVASYSRRAGELLCGSYCIISARWYCWRATGMAVLDDATTTLAATPTTLLGRTACALPNLEPVRAQYTVCSRRGAEMFCHCAIRVSFCLCNVIVVTRKRAK
jgi:hypothetical protein